MLLCTSQTEVGTAPRQWSGVPALAPARKIERRSHSRSNFKKRPALPLPSKNNDIQFAVLLLFQFLTSRNQHILVLGANVTHQRIKVNKMAGAFQYTSKIFVIYQAVKKIYNSKKSSCSIGNNNINYLNQNYINLFFCGIGCVYSYNKTSQIITWSSFIGFYF